MGNKLPLRCSACFVWLSEFFRLFRFCPLCRTPGAVVEPVVLRPRT